MSDHIFFWRYNQSTFCVQYFAFFRFISFIDIDRLCERTGEINKFQNVNWRNYKKSKSNKTEWVTEKKSGHPCFPFPFLKRIFSRSEPWTHLCEIILVAFHQQTYFLSLFLSISTACLSRQRAKTASLPHTPIYRNSNTLHRWQRLLVKSNNPVLYFTKQMNYVLKAYKHIEWETKLKTCEKVKRFI